MHFSPTQNHTQKKKQQQKNVADTFRETAATPECLKKKVTQSTKTFLWIHRFLFFP